MDGTGQERQMVFILGVVFGDLEVLQVAALVLFLP
jgi:hypothetical protein